MPSPTGITSSSTPGLYRLQQAQREGYVFKGRRGQLRAFYPSSQMRLDPQDIRAASMAGWLIQPYPSTDQAFCNPLTAALVALACGEQDVLSMHTDVMGDRFASTLCDIGCR
jgi:hypothetical protein